MNIIKKFKWLIILIIIILLILFLGEKLLNSTPTNTNNTQTSGTVETVKKGNLTKSVSANGTIETANYLSITTSVNGIVKKVYVKEGDSVNKGDQIMEITLDSEGEKSLQSAYANYLRAQNSLNDAKNSLNSLNSTQINKKAAFDNIKKTTSYQNETERNAYKIAENDYIKAVNDYNLQKSQISQQEISLSSAYLDYQAQSPTIIAPDSGIISNVVAVEGSKIENSVTSDRSVKTIASIKKEGTPIASLNISEVDISQVKVGQKVILSLTSNDAEKYEGIVAGIDKVGAVSSGVANYPVIVKFNKDTENILPNMTVSAEIIINDISNVLFVPSNAVETINNKKYVNLVEGNTTKLVEIETGFVGNTSTEVKSGLKEGDAVSVSALPTSGFTTTTNSNTRRPTSIFGIFGGR